MTTVTNIAHKKAEKEEADDRNREKWGQFIVLTFTANKDKDKAQELRQFLRDNPEMAEKWGTLADETKSRLLRGVMPDEGFRILAEKELEAMQKRLSEGTTSPVELMLIDAVMLCWLRVQDAENYRTGLMGGNQSMRQVEFAEKMLTSSHNRLAKTLTALARVQALAREKGAQNGLRLLSSVG
jgi:hypothetical protein